MKGSIQSRRIVTKTIFIAAAVLVAPALLYAEDGQILINQSTVMAAGGFPYKITQSGSYKLSGNLVVSTHVDAIDIGANNVTLDLNGFTISNVSTDACAGLLPCAFTAVGVNSTSNYGVTVRNGALSGFGTGVALQGAFNNMAEEIKALGVNTGLSLVGAVVRRNNVTAISTGISCSQCVITENVVFGLGNGLNISFSYYASNNLTASGVSGEYNTSGGNACGIYSC